MKSNKINSMLFFKIIWPILFVSFGLITNISFVLHSQELTDELRVKYKNENNDVKLSLLENMVIFAKKHLDTTLLFVLTIVSLFCSLTTIIFF